MAQSIPATAASATCRSARSAASLGEVRKALAVMDGLTKVRLIDAHSFCWMLEKLKGKKDGDREKCIIEMRRSVENIVRNANGQIVERTVKNKELRMTPAELQELLGSLLDLHGNCCALTGIPFHLVGSDADENLRPSVDRIDSNGHYEHDNLQIICQFVNFWKSDSDNDEFKRLLMLVRGEDGITARRAARAKAHDSTAVPLPSGRQRA